MGAAAPREPFPDALRALAMLAVLTVNAAGYLVAPWGALLGARVPSDSAAAGAVQGLTAALLQGKGYPTLAFLFGMGLWLAMRRRSAQRAKERGVARQKKLLALGVLHGVFVYFGDILTLYALIGWHLLARVHEPWRALRQRLHRALWWTLGVTALSVAVMGWLAAIGGLAGSESDAGEPTFALARQWRAFWLLNGSAYAVVQVGALLLSWPLLRLCMLCGVAAARLRLLTHRRWRSALTRWTVRLTAPLLLLNLAYGLATVSVPVASERAYWVESLGNLVGPPLAAVYVMALALAAQGGRARWCHWLAPLGRRTLTLYIGHSLLCVLLFAGVGLGLQPGTRDMALFSLVLWCLALWAARASGNQAWPLEAWLARP